MRLLLGVLLALGLAACQVAPVQSPEQVNPVRAMIARTVLLEGAGCTGIRIGEGRILTAEHCVSEVGEEIGPYVVQYIDEDVDFALLSGDDPILRVRMPDPEPGDHLYVVGYPATLEEDGEQRLVVTDGIYTGYEYEGYQRHTAYSYGGNSGGGVWSDAGDLIGVHVAGMYTGGTLSGGYKLKVEAHAYMTPIRFVRKAL